MCLDVGRRHDLHIDDPNRLLFMEFMLFMLFRPLLCGGKDGSCGWPGGQHKFSEETHSYPVPHEPFAKQPETALSPEGHLPVMGR